MPAIAPGIKYDERTPLLSLIPFELNHCLAIEVEAEHTIPVKNPTAKAAPIFKVKLEHDVKAIPP
jgi:hypothetical protein